MDQNSNWPHHLDSIVEKQEEKIMRPVQRDPATLKTEISFPLSIKSSVSSIPIATLLLLYVEASRHRATSDTSGIQFWYSIDFLHKTQLSFIKFGTDFVNWPHDLAVQKRKSLHV
jgi:hypothetical protein